MISNIERVLFAIKEIENYCEENKGEFSYQYLEDELYYKVRDVRNLAEELNVPIVVSVQDFLDKYEEFYSWSEEESSSYYDDYEDSDYDDEDDEDDNEEESSDY